jgi:hypothetical protein
MFQSNIYEYASSFKVVFNKIIDMPSRGTNSLIKLMTRFLSNKNSVKEYATF